MILYVVTGAGNCCCDNTVLGVYTSEELAQDRAEKCKGDKFGSFRFTDVHAIESDTDISLD